MASMLLTVRSSSPLLVHCAVTLMASAFSFAERLDSSGLLSDVLLRRGICYIHYGDTPSAIADLDAVLDFEHPNFLAYVRTR